MKKIIAFVLAALMVFPCFSIPVMAASETGRITDQTEYTNSFPGTVAHMGYTAKAPGNTAAAFREAGKAGFWGAEADVRATKDGVLICLHNETVNAMTNGSGAAYKKNWSVLKKYKINAGNNWRKYGTQHICTFSEYLDICKKYKMCPVVDIKWSSEKAVRAMYKMVKKKGMLGVTVFQCSVKNYLKYIKQESDKAVKKDKTLPKATMWYLVNGLSNSKVNTAKSLGCKGINCSSVSKSSVTYAHKKGIKVCYYLVFGKSKEKQLKKKRVDYLMSNRKLSFMLKANRKTREYSINNTVSTK